MSQNLWYQRLPLTKQVNPKVLTESVRRRANIGRSNWLTSSSCIPESKLKERFVGYCKSFEEREAEGVGLVLYGKHGSGKTSLGCLVLKWCLAKGGRALSIRYNTMVDRLVQFKPQFAPNGAPLNIALRHVNCLLIDDYEIDKGVRLQKFESVLRDRYDECLPTIITTNVPKHELFDIDWMKSLCDDNFLGWHVDGIDWRKEPPEFEFLPDPANPKTLL